MKFSVEDEIKTVTFKRPHVVLLGAGASRAAFQKGDKNGRKLPVMKDFIDVLGLEELLRNASVKPPYDDFESIYASLYEDPDKLNITKEIEVRIFDYFNQLELPDMPTLYDHLILSLRSKDVIATFNWDPFLWQAAARNHRYARLPRLIFLHGNVAIGFCKSCREKGFRGCLCKKCGNPYEPSRLLYPITKKNYNVDTFIESEWKGLKGALRSAYAFTIFGYATPVSDVEAVDLLGGAWGSPEERDLEEVEIIDILKDDILTERWDRFIHTHHYQIRSSFYDSLLSRHPRRTCEALWSSLMDCRFLEGSRIPQNSSFNELYDFLRPRIDAETCD